MFLIVLFSIPTLQTQLAKIVTKQINKNSNTNILVKKVDLSFLGKVQLKGIQIRDHHKDTLIFVENLETSLLNVKKIIDNNVNLRTASLKGVHFYMKTYKGETNDNLSIFIERFEDNKPKNIIKNPFTLNINSVYISKLTYKIIDENKKKPLEFLASNLGGTFHKFKIVGPNICSKIRKLHFINNQKIKVTDFNTDFSYTKTQMNFKNTILKTNHSQIKGNIQFNYKRKDFKHFNDKVFINATIKKSNLSLLDLHKLYKELYGNDILFFTGNITGTLNNFTANTVKLHSKKGMKITGNMKFINTLNNKRGFIFNGNFKNVTTNYYQLKNILPNILGKVMPIEIKKLGRFNVFGDIKVTRKKISTALTVRSKIGTTISNLKFTNINSINPTEYTGNITFKNFNIGVFTNNPLLGNISLKAIVKGKGFKIKNINTSFIAKISELNFKDYNYKNLSANGQLKNKKFHGFFIVQDSNLKMKFKGLADFSSKINKFDFTANINRVNLYKTNLFKSDSISILKGETLFKIKGNSLDDLIGKIAFKNIIYTNTKQKYTFKKFEINSLINHGLKIIKINSTDIIYGQLKGNFLFKELLPVAQNALGSIYTNYNPYVVVPHQFIDFNFTVYNQIINIFFPEIFIGKNTKIKGKIKADKNMFKLVFSCPQIKAYGNKIDKILLRMDNKNPLYNTHFTADNISTKYYTISKLNLLNKTKNDTLYFKSIFKGGKNKLEKYNLDFFYTFNQQKQSVIGIEKSTFNFKNNKWTINPKNDKNNKITFNLKTNKFNLKPFTLVSNKQKIQFHGIIKDSTYNNLEVDFEKVNLKSFLPVIDSLKLKGKLNGSLKFVKQNEKYSPQGSITIHDFYINNYLQGNLMFDLKGTDSYKKYLVDVSLKNKYSKSIGATGTLDFSTKQPTVNGIVSLNDFQLNAFSPLGEDILSKLKGKVSGKFTAKGILKNPDFQGLLSIKNGGLRFPYLNIDFNMEGNTNIKLQNQSFIFNNIVLKDPKYNTKGILSGNITHQNFKQWFLNLNINTDKLLVLNTKEQEQSEYYGRGFLKGEAKISGLTTNLTIDINGSTQLGTFFVIPLKDVKTVNNYKLIHFNSEKKDINNKLAIESVKGLALNLNLEVTKDAIAQVVIDKTSGSKLKGKGEGNLQIEIDTRRKFNIFGSFKVDQGVYDFKYGGIINRPFEVEKGGTISWDGDPFKAELNITAIYKTKANPGVLLDNFITNRKIPVDLYTKITGGLFNSKQQFDIRIPNVNSTISSELEFKINDNDSNNKMRQFFSLLITGSFFHENNLGVNTSSAIAGTTSDLISNVLLGILNNKDGKFKLGVDYIQGNKSNISNLNIDNQVDISLSTQLNNRILVNGKLGVPIGINTQTSVIGEVKVEVLLNKKGNFRGLVFINRQNEIEYSYEEQGYRQGMGLSYQVNFNNLSELLKKIGLKKKLIKKTTKKDSVLIPHKKLIHFLK